MEIWEPKPPGTLWATPGLLWDSFTFFTTTTTTTTNTGPGVAQWLRHYATSRVVPGLNPDGVGHRDFFSWIPTQPCALGSTQPLKNEYQGFPCGWRRPVREADDLPRQEIRGLNLPGPPWAILTACCGRDLYLLPLLLLIQLFFQNLSASHCIQWHCSFMKDI